MKRSGAGTLRLEQAGERVLLQAWVQRRRDHGGVIFLDLRDRSGIVQVVAKPDDAPAALATLDPVRSEWVVEVEGDGRGARAPRASIPKMPTGEIEVIVDARRRALEVRAAAVPDRRQRRGRRGDAPAVPLPRPAPARAAAEPDPAPPGGARGARLLPRARLPRHRDADPHQVDARGRARLPGAVARAPRRVLRAAAVAAALQAAPDGRRASSATSRSRAASATRTCAPTASPSSRRSTSRCRSRPRRTSTR